MWICFGAIAILPFCVNCWWRSDSKMLFEMLASAFFPDHFIHGPFYSSFLGQMFRIYNFFVLYRNSIFTFFLELLVNLDALKYVRFKPFLLNNCALNIIYEHLTWSVVTIFQRERAREKKIVDKIKSNWKLCNRVQEPKYQFKIYV